MAFSVQIDPAARRGLVRMWGVVTGPEILDACRTLFDDPAWRRSYGLLWDDLEIASIDIDVRGINGVAAEARFYRDRISLAAVVVRRPSVKVIAEMLIWFTQMQGVALFTSLPEAEAWLAREQAASAMPSDPTMAA